MGRLDLWTVRFMITVKIFCTPNFWWKFWTAFNLIGDEENLGMNRLNHALDRGVKFIVKNQSYKNRVSWVWRACWALSELYYRPFILRIMVYCFLVFFETKLKREAEAVKLNSAMICMHTADSTNPVNLLFWNNINCDGDYINPGFPDTKVTVCNTTYI